MWTNVILNVCTWLQIECLRARYLVLNWHEKSVTMYTIFTITVYYAAIVLYSVTKRDDVFLHFNLQRAVTNDELMIQKLSSDIYFNSCHTSYI